MRVLAGCDFLPSVPGVGVARAYALVLKHQNMICVSIFLAVNNHYR
jgi:exonuclease 1